MSRKRRLNDDIIVSDSEETESEGEFKKFKEEPIIEEIKIEPFAKVCGLRSQTDRNFDTRHVEYDRDLIVIYINNSLIYCYTIGELQTLFQNPVYETLNDGLITLMNDNLFIKLPFWNVHVEFFSLLFALQSGFNTIMLTSFLYQDLTFYNAFGSSRQDIFLEGENRLTQNDFICKHIAKEGDEYFVRIREDFNNGNTTMSWTQLESSAIMLENVRLRNFDRNWPTLITYNRGIIKSKTWLVNGELHREDGFARIMYFDDGSIEQQEWFTNGELHSRRDKPAIVIYNENGTRFRERWFTNGRLNRGNGLPADVIRDGNGYRTEEIWYINNVIRRITTDAPWIFYNPWNIKREERWVDQNDRFHRGNDRPAVIIYDEDENKREEQWFTHGELNRDDDEPAVIIYDESERVIEVQYFAMGNLHRDRGPAVIINESGNVTHRFFVNGDEIFPNNS